MKQRLKFAVQRWGAFFLKKCLGPHIHALIVKSENGLFAVDTEDLGVGGSLRMRASMV